MQVLYVDGGSLLVGTVVGLLSDEEVASTCENDGAHVFLKHFGVFASTLRIISVAALVDGAVADPPTVRFLRESAGPRGPEFQDVDVD